GSVHGIFDKVVPLAADGTFAGSGLVPASDVIPKGMRFRFTGSFAGPAAAHVTGALSFTFAGKGNPVSCAARRIETEARTAPKPPGTPAPKAAGAYYGTTADTGAVVLRVAADGTHVAQIGEEGWLDCSTKDLKQNAPFIHNTSPAAAIAAGGTFSGEERFDA